MSKKNYVLIAIVLVLATVYVVCFTNWFRPKIIKIIYLTRPVRAARTGETTQQLFFSLDNDYSLTELKVVLLDALQAGKSTQPIWHLVSEEGSDGVSRFAYGENISGMDPAVAGSEAEPLQPGVKYMLFINAGRAKGQLEFQLGAPPAGPPAKPAQPANSDN